MLFYGLVHAYSANVQRYLGIQEAILESSSYLVLISSMYTSTLGDSCLHQKVFVTALPVWTDSPSGRRLFHWKRFQQRPWPTLSTLVGSPDSAQRGDTQSISSSRKRPSGEVSSVVESGYHGTRKCSVDHSIPHHTHGISSHLEREPTSHNCGDDLWSSYKVSRRISLPIQTKRGSCYFCGKTQGVNAASLTLYDPTSRSPYNLRERGFGHMQPCLSAYRLLKKGVQPPYEGPYIIVNRTEKVFRILRHGKEVSVNIDRLKPVYIFKELEDMPVEVSVKKKVSLLPEEVPDSGQEKPRERSCRQETTTRSGHRVRFNPKYS
ncbi:hypothetical protein NPIL_592091 [Nephila pilipes]|uniref:Uncharacterized protein n=1 Tax=Nephila pilipes TaxID=299642 RepID=A0A8X6PSR5_NEPPI|nr:hypothetical protein NPIL_592091 [Nephila pilipes]